MMRTMIYLPEPLHKAIKHLAVERSTSFARLVQEALESLYKQDVKDLRIGRKRLADYLRHPEKTVLYSQYRSRRSRR